MLGIQGNIDDVSVVPKIQSNARCDKRRAMLLQKLKILRIFCDAASIV